MSVGNGGHWKCWKYSTVHTGVKHSLVSVTLYDNATTSLTPDVNSSRCSRNIWWYRSLRVSDSYVFEDIVKLELCLSSRTGKGFS